MNSITINSHYKVAYRPINKLNKFMKMDKDKLPRGCLSGIVYRLNCSECEASYIGQTKRKISTREVKGHKKVNPLHITVVGEHSLSTGHNFNWGGDRETDIFWNIGLGTCLLQKIGFWVFICTDTKFRPQCYARFRQYEMECYFPIIERFTKNNNINIRLSPILHLTSP